MSPVPVGSPTAHAILSRYLAEIVGRYHRRPATAEEVAEGVAEQFTTDPSDDLTGPRGTFLVAWLDGRPVGCVGVRLVPGEQAEVKRMFVAPEARRTGMGAALLAAAERAAGDLGARAVRLDTRTDLVEARAFYARHGYLETEPYSAEIYADHFFRKELPVTGDLPGCAGSRVDVGP
ncbi:GNAT family N-acetyltransferase [Amycolatopsis antarctica]|uniref:GNAT family N-acetyltransferase n=1 Tax=Amycolatopsis antarctica TaxID=1854586 RepID=A0A263CVH8_9PSEU|nr:GNAT family N-acetyltransferase [Amycolatopsis antarctica]